MEQQMMVPLPFNEDHFKIVLNSWRKNGLFNLRIWSGEVKTEPTWLTHTQEHGAQQYVSSMHGVSMWCDKSERIDPKVALNQHMTLWDAYTISWKKKDSSIDTRENGECLNQLKNIWTCLTNTVLTFLWASQWTPLNRSALLTSLMGCIWQSFPIS